MLNKHMPRAVGFALLRANKITNSIHMSAGMIRTNGRTPPAWAKFLLFISLGKAFVAGAGLGLAALGVADLAGTLGIRPLVDFLQYDQIFKTVAIGGGFISAGYKLVSAFISR